MATSESGQQWIIPCGLSLHQLSFREKGLPGMYRHPLIKAVA
jgi:hypothetical protein